jgi:hypothetical protein
VIKQRESKKSVPNIFDEQKKNFRIAEIVLFSRKFFPLPDVRNILKDSETHRIRYVIGFHRTDERKCLNKMMNTVKNPCELFAP